MIVLLLHQILIGIVAHKFCLPYIYWYGGYKKLDITLCYLLPQIMFLLTIYKMLERKYPILSEDIKWRKK